MTELGRVPGALAAASKRHFFLSGALALVAILLAIGGARAAITAVTTGGQEKGGAARTVAVSAVAANKRAFADNVEALGQAKGLQAVNISSSTTELVTRVRMKDGAFVHAGDVLVDLKAKEEQADISQARAALDVAKLNYTRYKTLFDKGFLAQAALDQYAATYHQAQAALAAADSREQDRVIRAPFAGRIGITDVAPGALINPGAVIATLDDVSTMRVDFDVPDRFLPALHPGATLTARPDPYPNTTVNGRLGLIDTRIDPATHAIRARAEFPNPKGLLVPGMLMHVAIQTGQRQSLALPESAVQADDDQSYVYVIAKKGGAMVAVQTSVEIGQSQDGFVEITRGVAEGALVVADGLDRVSPNGPVRIVSGDGAKDAAKAAVGNRKKHNG